MKIIGHINLRKLLFSMLLMIPMSSIAITLTFDDSTTANLNPYSSGGYTVQAYIYGNSTTNLTPNVNSANLFNYNKDYLTNNWGGSLSPSAKVTKDSGELFDLNSISLGSGSSSEQVNITLTGLDVDGAIIITQTFASQVQLTNHALTGFTYLHSLEISGTTRFSFDDIDVTKPSPTAILTFDNATTANLNPYTSSGYTVQAQIYGTSSTNFTANVNRANQFNYNKDYLTNNWGGSLSPSAKVTNDSETLFDVNSISLGSGSKYETVDITLTGFDADDAIIITQTFSAQVQLTNHSLTGFTRLHSLVISGTTRFSFDDVELTLNTEEPEPKQASFIFRKVFDTADCLSDSSSLIMRKPFTNTVDGRNRAFIVQCDSERTLYRTVNSSIEKLVSTSDIESTYISDSVNPNDRINYLSYVLDYSDEDGSIIFEGSSRSDNGYDRGIFEYKNDDVKYLLRASDYRDQDTLFEPQFLSLSNGSLMIKSTLKVERIELLHGFDIDIFSGVFILKNNILSKILSYGTTTGYSFVSFENEDGSLEDSFELTFRKRAPGVEFYRVDNTFLDDDGSIYFSAIKDYNPNLGPNQGRLYRYYNGSISTLITSDQKFDFLASDEFVCALDLLHVKESDVGLRLHICREGTNSYLRVKSVLYNYDGRGTVASSDNLTAIELSSLDNFFTTSVEQKSFSVGHASSTPYIATNLDDRLSIIPTPLPVYSNPKGFFNLYTDLGDKLVGFQGGYRNVENKMFGYVGMMLLDSDSDGVPDIDDNCPITSNLDQLDTNLDGYGDACQDSDGDTVLDFNLITMQYDNCPLVANALQLDDDNDTVGSACDNCPMTTNLSQLDTDSDGIGDACDQDLDNDLVFNDIDNCLFIANSDQADLDGDSLGDVCDNDIDADGIANSIDGTLDGTGLFIDQSLVSSNHFTDQHLGGSSFGSVVAGTLTYFISDIVGTEGVLAIGISGSSSDKKSLSICGWKINEGGLLNLLVGSEVNITCGSVIMRTEGTPAELVVGENAKVLVMPGGGMKAKDTADGQFSVETLPESVVPVLIVLGTDTLVTIPPLATAQVTEEEPGQFSVVNDDASEAPITALVGGQEVVYQPGETGVAVEIDIKPGETPNAINLGSNGNIPVAIMSTATFDAQTVDPMSVTLAGAGIKLKGKSEKPMASFKDINGDGLFDLLTHVDTTALELAEGAASAVLEARTYDGKTIRGSDSILVVK